MKKYVCTVCGYIAEGSIPEQCPVCKASVCCSAMILSYVVLSFVTM